MPIRDDIALNNRLNTLVSRAEKVLTRAYINQRGSYLWRWALLALFLFPLPLLLVELCRYGVGAEPWGLTLWHYAVLSLLVAAVTVTVRLLSSYLSLSIPRGRSLALFDQQLHLANRLVTADEFMAEKSRTGFMSAAIDDAVTSADRAIQSELQRVLRRGGSGLSRWVFASVPAFAGVLLLTAWLGGLQLANADNEALQPMPLTDSDSPRLEVLPNDSLESLGEQTDQGSNKPLDPKRSVAEKGESSEGEAPDSEAGEISRNAGGQPMSQESQNNSASSQSGGTPSGSSSQAQSASAGGQQSASGGSKKPKIQSRQANQNATQPQAGASQQKEGSKPKSPKSGRSGQSGESHSSGSLSNAGQTGASGGSGSEDPSSQQEQQDGEGDSGGEGEAQGEGQGKGQGKGQGEGEGPVGESQEQKQGQGGQPSSSGEITSKGEGQGSGKDEIKKNRGAAKAMLALPTSDRLIGVRNKGSEQTRQQQSTPQQEQVGQLSASQRINRSGRIGELQHSRVSGWSRSLVENYFNQLRNQPDSNSKSEGEK